MARPQRRQRGVFARANIKRQDLIACNGVGKWQCCGFNSDRYDLNLIRKHFLIHLGEEKVDSGEKQGQIMYMKTLKFNFLDVTNYLSPGISYDRWVKTYGVSETKSWGELKRLTPAPRTTH